MALPASGNSISMDQMRTEFGVSGAISMSDLYRGGSEVPSSVNTTVTVSEVANILLGAGYGSGHRWNHGCKQIFDYKTWIQSVMYLLLSFVIEIL